MNLRQPVETWLVAATVGGLWLGVGGRGVMVLIALAGGHPSRWSWGGSAEILLFGLIIAAIATAAWMGLRRLLPVLRAGGGLLLGALLFGGLAVLLPPSAQAAAEGFGQRPLTLVLFGVVLVVFGVIVEQIVVSRHPSGGSAQ